VTEYTIFLQGIETALHNATSSHHVPPQLAVPRWQVTPAKTRPFIDRRAANDASTLGNNKTFNTYSQAMGLTQSDLNPLCCS
jgi:hypothetical protein